MGNRFFSLIEKMTRKHKRPIGASWRMEETYFKVKGIRRYLYRAVDRKSSSVNFFADDGARHGRSDAFPHEGNGSERRSRQSRDGQERCQQGGDDAVNAGRAVPIFARRVNTSTTSSNRTIAPSSG